MCVLKFTPLRHSHLCTSRENREHISRLITQCTAPADGQSERPLEGLIAVVLGTGGAARALAFGAVARGANVVVAGRRLERAQELAYNVSESRADGAAATACSVEAVQKGELESMHVVMNTTPLGMIGERENETPVPVDTLQKVLFSSFFLFSSCWFCLFCG